MHEGNPFSAFEMSDSEIVEYFDVNNRRLFVGSHVLSSNAGFWRRKIGVILYDMRRRVYVCRRMGVHVSSHCWDISVSGFVGVSESSEDAALRHVQVQMGDMPAPLHSLHFMQYIPCSWFVSLYCIGPSHVHPSLHSASGQFMDRHELTALYEYAPELCTPLLTLCLTSHLLWRASSRPSSEAD